LPSRWGTSCSASRGRSFRGPLRPWGTSLGSRGPRLEGLAGACHQPSPFNVEEIQLPVVCLAFPDPLSILDDGHDPPDQRAVALNHCQGCTKFGSRACGEPSSRLLWQLTPRDASPLHMLHVFPSLPLQCIKHVDYQQVKQIVFGHCSI
jgi:hypothetical protein